MTPEEFILSVYAGMLRAGIPMRDIDETDLHRYLQVLSYNAKRSKKENHESDRNERTDANHGKAEKVVYLRRGTVDEFW